VNAVSRSCKSHPLPKHGPVWRLVTKTISTQKIRSKAYTVDMVQYRIDSRGHLAYRRDLDPDHYWKLETVAYLKDAPLDREILRLKLFRNPKLSKSRKIELCARAQRGSLPYDIYNLLELKDFARNRKIPSSHGRLSVPLLTRQLERADDDATFPRFSELPPELRQAVFEHYFASIAKERMNLVFKQPPATMASRLFRNEALPLFYRMCTFEVEIRTCRAIPQRGYDVYKRPACVLDRGSHDFIEHVSEEKFRLIRRLAITVQLFSFKQYVRMILDLEGEGSARVEKFESDRPGDEVVPKNLVKELDSVVKYVARRPEVQKLKKVDVENVLEAVDHGLQDWQP